MGRGSWGCGMRGRGDTGMLGHGDMEDAQGLEDVECRYLRT